MRRLLLFLILVLTVSHAAAEVHYSIDTNSSTARINATIGMECERTCPRLNWLKPDNTEVLSVKDGDGLVEYTDEGDAVTIPGARGSDRRVLKIQMRQRSPAEEIHEGLYKATFRLSGFEAENTSGKIRAENLLSGKTGYGFEESFKNSSMSFKGTGPVNIRVKFGEGNETRYFSFFGENPGEVPEAYEVAAGSTGTVQRFKRFPVAVYSDEEYDSRLNKWSAGEYMEGAIQIRRPESFDDSSSSFEAVLAHEVVHGLNDRLMNWDSTRTSYLDEGTSKYVETLVNKNQYHEGDSLNKPANLFGEDKRYEVEKNGEDYIYTIPSRGDREQLWSYYRENKSFMKHWNAFNSPKERRSFGYAYSELIVRNYVANNNSLKTLYSSLDVGEEVESPERKWSLLSERLNMKPCDYESRERFESCLDRVNGYDYPVYTASPAPDTGDLEIQEIELPERQEPTEEKTGETGNRSSLDSPENVTMADFLSEFWDFIVDSVNSLVRGAASLI